MNKNTVDNIIFRTVSLSKFYTQTKSFALRDLSIIVTKGEFVGIKGPSGSGKSTLLYLLAGLSIPTSGEIYFKEKRLEDIKNKALYRRHNIGFVFQDFYLYPNFTVLENMLFPCMYRLGIPDQIIKRADKQLESLDMQDKRDSRVEGLSAGERQRVCIARALLYEPECILADEPTGNLDSQNAKNTLGLLKKLNDEYKTTILLVTHDDMISDYAHRIVHIIDGSIKKE